MIYTARAGDSLVAIARRYGAALGSGAGGEILALAKRQHTQQYRGRGLWVGDEVRLMIPLETGG